MVIIFSSIISIFSFSDALSIFFFTYLLSFWILSRSLTVLISSFVPRCIFVILSSILSTLVNNFSIFLPSYSEGAAEALAKHWRSQKVADRLLLTCLAKRSLSQKINLKNLYNIAFA